MEANEYSVGLDIGTTKIVAIVGRSRGDGSRKEQESRSTKRYCA